MNYHPEGYLINQPENLYAISSYRTLVEAMRTNKILEAKAIMCDSKHNLVVELGHMKGIIPREEGAIGIREGTVRDIAILSQVNHPVSFVVENIAEDKYQHQYAILSRRKAQERCLTDYLNHLVQGDVIPARITHIEPFGAFCDIGCGLVSLLPIDSISVSRIEHPNERFSIGMDIMAIVKLKENGRITLSHKELLGTWEENAARFHAGETVSGIVRSIESYGIFVELTPNLAGLAELKDNIFPGQEASVFIKSILPDKMKIKLIIIEAFNREKRQIITKPIYFFFDSHMDQFTYSPPHCSKRIQTEFHPS